MDRLIAWLLVSLETLFPFGTGADLLRRGFSTIQSDWGAFHFAGRREHTSGGHQKTQAQSLLTQTNRFL